MDIEALNLNDNTIVLLFTAIEDESFTDFEKPSLIIFPNPTSGEIHLDLSTWSYDQQHSFKLYQLDGQLIYGGEFFSSTSIHIGDFGIREGLYLLCVEVGEWSYTRKIIYTP